MADKKGTEGNTVLKVILQLAGMLVLIGIDRVIKIVVEANVPVGEAVTVIPGFFYILHIKNTGAAFSILAGARIFLVVLTVVLIAAAVFYLIKYRSTVTPLQGASLVLICGGGISNLIDRIATGAVTDYLSFGKFAIFNFADVCVCAGCGLLILWIISAWTKTKEE